MSPLILVVFAILVILLTRQRTCPPGYSLLKNPTQMRLYEQPSSALEQSICKSVADKYLLKRVKNCLRGQEDLLQQWVGRVGDADAVSIVPPYAGRVAAWASVRSAIDSKFVVGMERWLRPLGPLAASALNHELIHCAQEVRENALTKDWKREISFGRWVMLELEAFWKAPLFPMFFFVVLAPFVLF